MEGVLVFLATETGEFVITQEMPTSSGKTMALICLLHSENFFPFFFIPSFFASFLTSSILLSLGSPFLPPPLSSFLLSFQLYTEHLYYRLRTVLGPINTSVRKTESI